MLSLRAKGARRILIGVHRRIGSYLVPSVKLCVSVPLWFKVEGHDVPPPAIAKPQRTV